MSCQGYARPGIRASVRTGLEPWVTAAETAVSSQPYLKLCCVGSWLLMSSMIHDVGSHLQLQLPCANLCGAALAYYLGICPCRDLPMHDLHIEVAC